MTPSNVRATAAAWLASRRAAVLVQVVAHRGSVPRETGTCMLVTADTVVGTIGGGHLELQAIARARAGNTGDWSVALGPTLGQCCGGALTLHTAPLTAAALAAWPEPVPRFVLQLYGAGHVGRAIVAALAPVDCRVTWLDEREDQFPLTPDPHQVQRLCVEPVEAEVAMAPRGAFYLVLTHSHDLDQRITEAVLKRADFGWLGLIGSATKRARFLHRFEQRGIPPETLARLTCPIGLPGISGKEPGVIAAGVVAQLLSVSAPGSA